MPQSDKDHSYTPELCEQVEPGHSWFSMNYNFRVAPYVGSDYGKSSGHRFQKSQRNSLGQRGQYEQRCGGQQGGDVLNLAKKVDAVTDPKLFGQPT